MADPLEPKTVKLDPHWARRNLGGPVETLRGDCWLEEQVANVRWDWSTVDPASVPSLQAALEGGALPLYAVRVVS